MHDITNISKRLNDSLHLPVLVIIEPLLLPRTCILNVLRRELDELEILDMATVQGLDCTSTRDVRVVVLSIANKSIGDPLVEDDLAFVAECCPNAAIVVLSNHDDEPTVQAAMQRGVRGFLSTSLPIEIVMVNAPCSCRRRLQAIAGRRDEQDTGFRAAGCAGLRPHIL